MALIARADAVADGVAGGFGASEIPRGIFAGFVSQHVLSAKGRAEQARMSGNFLTGSGSPFSSSLASIGQASD